MKTLILYRSYYGNTKTVAEAIAQQIVSAGHEAAVQDLRMRLPDLESIDALIIGAPTRMGRVTGKARSVLRRLRKRGFGDKPVAAFDTVALLPTDPEEMAKARKYVEPGAVGIMQRIAKDQGLNLFPDALRCEVTGMKGPLADNAHTKAAAFASSFLAFAQKRKG